MAFILSMCVALPLTLYPQRLLRSLHLINRVQSEKMALWTGQWCARWLMRLIPFCHITPIPDPNNNNNNKSSSSSPPPPQPAVWVCNHTSMLDVFVLLATDLQLRGKNKRPIKIVYVSLLSCHVMPFLDLRRYISLTLCWIVCFYLYLSLYIYICMSYIHLFQPYVCINGILHMHVYICLHTCSGNNWKTIQ